MSKKHIFLTISLLALIFACQRTLIYSPIAEKYEPDFRLNRFENEIKSYEKIDSTIGIDKLKGQIVFYGSSSIRFWKTMKQDFAPLPVINHGFGGSTFPEMTHYAERMLVAYQPKTLVLYCENDLFVGKTKTPEQVFDAFGELATLIKNRLPKTKVIYISMKPSISRKADWAKVQKADAMIKAMIDKNKNFSYVDIRSVMYRPNGSINGDYFVKDSLHMTQKGYDEWTKIVRPVLLKSY